MQLELPNLPPPATAKRRLDMCPRCKSLHFSAEAVEQCKQDTANREQY